MPPPKLSALVPLILMRLGMLGMGYVLGGIALLAKRIGGGLVNLISMGLFAVAFVPVDAKKGLVAAVSRFLPYGGMLLHGSRNNLRRSRPWRIRGWRGFGVRGNSCGSILRDRRFRFQQGFEAALDGGFLGKS